MTTRTVDGFGIAICGILAIIAILLLPLVLPAAIIIFKLNNRNHNLNPAN